MMSADTVNTSSRVQLRGRTASQALPTEIIGGVSIATLSRVETARLMVDMALRARGSGLAPCICSSVNGQVLADLYVGRNRHRTQQLLACTHVLSADGQPLVFASRLLGNGALRDRSATTDLFHDVAKLAAAEGASFYMLGASEDENRSAVGSVRARYPGLRIVGRRNGYFASTDEELLAVQEINVLRPDILWVAMGFPRELEFCHRWRQELTNVGVMKTSGGLFNFLSGAHRRAPQWMQSVGLEWAHRLYLEPRRLLVRYATTNVIATWALLSKTRHTPQ